MENQSRESQDSSRLIQRAVIILINDSLLANTLTYSVRFFNILFEFSAYLRVYPMKKLLSLRFFAELRETGQCLADYIFGTGVREANETFGSKAAARCSGDMGIIHKFIAECHAVHAKGRNIGEYIKGSRRSDETDAGDVCKQRTE